MTATLNGQAPTIGVPDVSHSIVLVSSKMAQDWLKRYQGPSPDAPDKPGNRKINDAKVLRFVADMEANRWLFDGSPVRFSDESPKRILDGQNRLTALANTVPEMELPFLVIHGLERQSQMVMDQCEVRTVAQNLHLTGVKNATTTGAAAKFYLDWTRGRLYRSTTRGTTTKPETQEWVLDHPDLLVQLYDTDFTKVDAPVSVVGAFTLAVLQFAPIRAHKFLTQLAMGVNLDEGNPILALDRRLRNIRRTGVKVTQREYLAYFIKAWNASTAGSPLQRIQLGRLDEDTFPALLQVGD